jgi:hypothetical protein
MFHDVTQIVPGQRWYAASGNGHFVQIVSVVKYGEGKWDHNVTYEWYEGGECVQHSKDAWNFQVRYFSPLLDNIGDDSANVAQRRSVWEK